MCIISLNQLVYKVNQLTVKGVSYEEEAYDHGQEKVADRLSVHRPSGFVLFIVPRYSHIILSGLKLYEVGSSFPQ